MPLFKDRTTVMSQPARPFAAHAQKLYKVIQRQSWLLLTMIIAVAVIDYSLQHRDFGLTKNTLAGGLLAWVSHWLFAKIALRHSGYHQRRQVVNSFYLAQGVKWLITLAGFATIFMLLQPLKPLWVFIGYFTMQLGQIILLYRYNHQG